jgi:hypothetical protein
MPEVDEDDCLHALKELEMQRANWASFLRNKKDIWSEKWLWDGKQRAEMASNHLKKKFMQVFSSKMKTQKQVKYLVRSGVPPELRGQVWWACSGAAEKRMAAPADQQYTVLLTRLSELDSTHIANDIEKDLLRTFPERINSSNTRTIDALRRCLRAYALRNTEVGYCQSMNYICALLLLHMSEEQAFWVFACMVEDILPPAYYTPSLIGGRVDQQVFQSCIAWKLPRLFAVFKSTNTLLEPIICPWFLCLYINVLPLSVVCRVWDCMFWEGSVVLFRIGLTLMKSKSKYIVEANDFVQIYTILKVSNNKSYSFDLECRDKDNGFSPSTPPNSSLSLPGQQPSGGLDILQDFGSISRGEFLINSAFGFRWLKSVPKAKVEILREKFLALLEDDREKRSASGAAPALGLITDNAGTPTSPSNSSLVSRFSGIFRLPSGSDVSSPPGSPVKAGSPHATQQTAAHTSAGDNAEGERADLAAAISKHQSLQSGKGQALANRGARSRQSLAMLKLLDELEYVPASISLFFMLRSLIFSIPGCSRRLLVLYCSINSLRSLAMDLDEGLSSKVEEFAREMDSSNKPGQGAGVSAGASPGVDAEGDADSDADYGEFEDADCGPESDKTGTK